MSAHQAAMVEGIVINHATQPLAGSIAWAKGWALQWANRSLKMRAWSVKLRIAVALNAWSK